MTDLRTAAQQALEALEKAAWCVQHDYQPENMGNDWDEQITALRAALAEEALQKFTDVNQELEAALAEPVQDGFDQLIAETEADSKGAQALEEGRRWVNEQFYAGAEPVAWRFQSAVGGWAYGSQPPLGSKYTAYPLYAAPPQRKPKPVALDWLHKWANQDDGEPETQWHEGYEAARRVVQIHLTTPPPRKPLTEEEILSLFRTSGSPVEFARAIEAQHGIGDKDVHR